ncbi:hypothetical protein C8R43DRAFT_888494 [Mycena crocata]|nr:hypothetical protein C8R43DRAFT_888494 [Mycena crocata]
MKLASSLLLALLSAASTFAQHTRIGAPLNGTRVKAGSQITVEVDRPDTLTSSTEVAIVIAFLNCFSHPCPSPMDELGNILYKGSYHPQWHDVPRKPPHQNFTVTVPKSASTGAAQLSVVHLSLAGAVNFPFFESHNITLLVK